jgi:hypothetical protein
LFKRFQVTGSGCTFAQHAHVGAPGIRANEEHASWATSLPVVVRCRKLQAGTAILSADGDLLAVASAIWIELRDAAG